MVADKYAGATWRPVSYRGEAGYFSGTPLGWILHVVVGNGSPFNTFQNAPAGNRRFSHFWVSKSGLVEQYQVCSMKSWAQGEGNGTYYSIETEGYPEEPLTTKQINELAKLHNFLKCSDLQAGSPGNKGIGTHYMGGSAWGGHTCPDPSNGAGPRSRQRDEIISEAQALRSGGSVEDDMPSAEEVADTTWSQKYKEYLDENGNGARDLRSVVDILYSAHQHAVSAYRVAAETQAAIESLQAKVAEIAVKLAVPDTHSAG